jgi:DNA-binding transcriptional LysR family regulator
MQKAAQMVHMSQPAISKMVLEIEEIFGARLFERTRRGVEPTAAGDALVQRARLLLVDAAAAREEVASVVAGTAGVVRVGVQPVVESDLLRRAILRLRQEAPGLTVALQEGAREGLMEALAHGDLDCVIGRLAAGDSEAGFQQEVLCELPVAIVAGRHHPLARRKRVGWSELAGFEWILPPLQAPVRHAIEAQFAAVRVAPPTARITSTSILTNRALVENSALLAVIPEATARYYAGTGALVILPVRLEIALPPVGILTRRTPVSSAAGRFLAAIRQEAEAISSPLRPS